MVYRVLADGIDIFGSDTESSLLSPSLETELNSAGSLEFTLPPDHPSYDDISLMQTEIEVYEDNDLIFLGRPAEINIDWNNQKKVVCEGALAYLNDAAIRPHKFEGTLISDVFKYIIAQYNAQVAQNRQFIVGNITIVDRYVYTEFDYDICLSVLTSTCIDSTGGYLFLRKEDDGIYIDWLDEVPDVSDQPVQFASNMLDLTQDTRAEDICTVVLPVGGQVDGVNITIASVNQGSDILEDSDAIAKYGRILKIQQWNDIIDPQALKDKATEWLTKQQEDDITIETDAAELHYLDGSVGAYRIGQLVNVISGPHGVDKEYPILKMSMDLDSGTKKITLGTPPRKELTELSGITNSTGGGSSSSGGGGGSSDGVRDVIVNGSSVVSDHVARISAVTSQQLADGLALKADEDDFEVLQTAVAGKASQADLNALSTTVAGKASQADLNTLSTTVAGKQDQLTPGTGIEITNNVISATGGGGTEVEANPSDPATDDLNTIKIGDTVYDIPGGGSTTNYGKFTCDVLFVNDPLPHPTQSGTANVTRNYTLSKSIDDYDAVYIIVYGYYYDSGSTVDGPNQKLSGMIFNSDYYSDNNWLFNSSALSRNQRLFLRFTDNTHVETITTRSDAYDERVLYKVYGLKFENKLINRSDIYSEEERMIGRWTDGKPLYQKVVTIPNFPNNNRVEYQHNIANVDTIFVAGGFGTDSNSGTTSPLVLANSTTAGQWHTNVNKTVVGIWAGSDRRSINVVKVILNYTKTTDSPGSGVIPEDPQMVMMSDYYSEEEQVVGRWTDGKPVYQKTYIWTNTELNQWVNHDVSDINIDTMVDIKGWLKRIANGQVILIHPIGYEERTNNAYSAQCRYTATNNTIDVYNALPSGNSSDQQVITIQYTKTTDAPGTGPTKGNLIYLPALYSEEEREVGVWTDGKPVYQKSYRYDNTSSQTVYVDVSSLNIDRLVLSNLSTGMGTPQNQVAGNWYMSGYDYGNCYFNTVSNNIEIRRGTDWEKTANGVMTIQYTKTTDQPGSGTWTPEGQLAHHYSTSEKVVGTWIDGSTVYERTWDFSDNPKTVAYNSWTSLGINIPNGKELLSSEISSGAGGIDACGIEFELRTNDNYSVYAEYNQNANTRKIKYLTFRYTKSS